MVGGLDATGTTPLVRLRSCEPERRRGALGEVGGRQPDREHEGPDGRRDDRPRRAKRGAPARHAGSRVHRRQHGKLARDGLRRPGLPGAPRHRRLLRAREDPDDARVRSGGRGAGERGRPGDARACSTASRSGSPSSPASPTRGGRSSSSIPATPRHTRHSAGRSSRGSTASTASSWASEPAVASPGSPSC